MVAECLEIFEFLNQNRMPEMEVGGGWIKASLYPEGLAGLYRMAEFFEEFLLGYEVNNAPFYYLKLLFNVHGGI